MKKDIQEILLEEKNKKSKKQDNTIKSTEENKMNKLKLVKEKVTGKTKEIVSAKNFKKVVTIGVGTIGLVGIIVIAKSCTDSQNENNENEKSITTTTTKNSIVEENEITTLSEITELSGVIIEETTREENELEEFASIKYINKDELVELLQKAQLEFEGINITTEELAAFIVEINKTVINSELEQVLISSGVISEEEDLNRQNYLNTIDKIRNAMINAKTIEIDPELVGMPEYDALIEELKANAVEVNLSNLVSGNSSEHEMYELLDQTYYKIGEATSIKEAIESYEPILEYVNSENAKNMPNNIEEEIFKDLYKDVYDEITAAKFGFLVTETGYEYDYFEEITECEKTLIK